MMLKIWVKRPGASPARVQVQKDDLVDDLRDVILRKYSNSLGRTLDSPDVIIRVGEEDVLKPEDSIDQLIKTHFPNGQGVNDALLIDIPQRRTPLASPRAGLHMPYYIPEEGPDLGPGEYFPPMPALRSPHLNSHDTHHAQLLAPHSIAILNSQQQPALPSPGTRAHRNQTRPLYRRQPTPSPTVLHQGPPNGQLIDPKHPPQTNGISITQPQPLPTPPAQVGQQPIHHKPSITPPIRSSSPAARIGPAGSGQKSRKKQTKTDIDPNRSNRPLNAENPPPRKDGPAGLLDGTVPPINVLIVEDNVINLKVLEAFMKRLKVRWKTAMNGREAVTMWRTGGFHLVLMDIQLPVMNGLDATREIRRLEAVNNIGIFSGSQFDLNPMSGHTSPNGEISGEDRLGDKSLFMSPVIIVALTASSLQSDRHDALAAGCNDFLTKPVHFPWMERKVTEWGCMQALIDFDGWRKWKDIAANEASKKDDKDEKAKAKAAMKAQFLRGPPKKAQAQS